MRTAPGPRSGTRARWRGAGDVWRVHCRPSAAASLIRSADAQAVLIDWGGGLVWMRVPGGTDLRARLGRFDGHAARVTGRPDRAPRADAVAALEDGIRARFDPRGLLGAAPA